MRACFPCPRLSPSVPVPYTPPSRRLGATASKRHKRKLGDHPTASRGKGCTLLVTGYRDKPFRFRGWAKTFHESQTLPVISVLPALIRFFRWPHPAVDVLLYYICVLGN